MYVPTLNELHVILTIDTDLLLYIASLKNIAIECDVYLITSDRSVIVEIQVDDISLVIHNNGSATIKEQDDIVIASDDELEIITEFNKLLKKYNYIKQKEIPVKLDRNSDKESLYRYVKERLSIIRHGNINHEVSITDDIIDKQFTIASKIGHKPFQLILTYSPVTNALYKNDSKYDLYTIFPSKAPVEWQLSFPRFYIDIYDRQENQLNKEPIDLLVLLCYSHYTIADINSVERLTNNVEGCFVTITKSMFTYSTYRPMGKYNFLFSYIPKIPTLYMCIEKEDGKYIVTDRVPVGALGTYNTFKVDRKDIKPYKFVNIK